MSDGGHLWIDSEQQLRDFVYDVEKKVAAGAVTACYLDTEADSLHHYQEKLCLIQLAVGGTFALIDPLAISAMDPLLGLLDKLEVWFHGADYDLTMFRRTYAWAPRVVRDTQIAARLAGHRQFGLAALVEKEFSVQLSKASQKADWSRRPLPDKMLAYAVDDVRWLGPLSERLREELNRRKRWVWFEQSCSALRSDVLARQKAGRDEVWRVSGSGSLRPKGLAALRAIWLWRDALAQERDVPPFRVLNNQQMLTMAAEFESGGPVNVPPRWRGRWRQTFLDAVESVQHLAPESWPQRQRNHGKRTTEQQRTRIEGLCKARDRIAESLGIDTALLGSRAVMEQLVLRPDGEGEEPLMPWQREVLAEVLGDFIPAK